MFEESKYPNGWLNYLETLVMMSVELEIRDLPMHLINYIDYAIEWSEEFEQIHKDRVWDDDWLDAIKDFVDEKIFNS
jgi:hypothetical protein